MSEYFDTADVNIAVLGSQRIDKTGAYEGEFIRAECVVYGTGSRGIEFDFRAKNGDIARFINVCTSNQKGDELFGKPIILGMMIILKCKKMAPSLVDAETWDKSAGKFVIKTIKGFPELMGHPIGLILQKEHSTTPDGEIKERMNICNCFNVETKMTAREMINGATSATDISRMLDTIKDKWQGPRSTGAIKGADTKRKSNGSSDFDDDIPS